MKNILVFIKRPMSIIGIVIIVIVIGIIIKNTTSQTAPQYQTTQATRGTLITSVSESGTVAVANRMSVTTSASGVVSEIDAKNGDTVVAGQKIAVLSLDRDGQQRQAQAYASYLSAKSSSDQANATLFSLQSTLYNKWNIYTTLATNSTYQNPDGSPNIGNRTLPAFTTVQDDWLAAEAAFKNQQGVIAQSQASLNSAALASQTDSAIITAPQNGTLGDVTIAPGMQITSNTSTTTNTTSSQAIASIKTSGNPVITVSLSEIDAAKVQAGQKATISFDALPSLTFTGKVLGINTTGAVASGVTTYPASIMLDTPNDKILPNMSATANIITLVKDNVILVPSAAVKTVGGQSIVQVMKNGTVTSVPVTTGNSSDTDTEIVSGINDGDMVVTSSTAATTTSSSTTSPFGGSLRGFGGGGAGAVRVGGRAGGQ